MAHLESGFEVVWEVVSPAGSDRAPLHRQLDTARWTAHSVLVPDNHTGRATVSSIAVARRVNEAGLHAIACLNARDRNLLGLRRDLLTCGFEGVDDVLLVYGDEPDIGTRAADLKVRTMLEECRAHGTPQVGVTTRLRSLPGWKLDADRLFVQVSYDLDDLLRWRETIAFDGPVVPAVFVIPTTAMARRLAARIPELSVPETWLAAIEADPVAGVELAAELVEHIRDSGAFDGVHIIAGVRHLEAAERLRGFATSRHARTALAAPA